MDFGGFSSHFLILILHALSSLKARQLASGSSGDGGADGGSVSHRPQVFLQFCSFSELYFLHFFVLHFSCCLSAHAGGLDGGGGGGLGDGGGGLGEGGGGDGEGGGGDGDGGLGGGGLGEGGGGDGEGGGGDGDGGLGGGGLSEGGGGGGEGDGSLQQAFLHFPERFFLEVSLHSFVQAELAPFPEHLSFTFFSSFFLHTSLSMRASQPIGDGFVAPIINGSHHGGQATPSSFSTRSPERSIAVGSRDALCATPVAASAGQVFSNASCTAKRSLRTSLSCLDFPHC